jgi:hypothetical protein
MPTSLTDVAIDMYGSCYVGQVNSETGMWHGRGVFTRKNTGRKHEGEIGESYDGEWRDDTRSGSGVMTRSDGMRYSGEWKCNNMEGKGIFWSPGRQLIFDGAFEGGRLLKGTAMERDGNLSRTDFGGRASVSCFSNGDWERAVRTPAGRVVSQKASPQNGSGGCGWAAEWEARVILACGAVLEVRMVGLRPCGVGLLVEGGQRFRVEYDGSATLAEAQPVSKEVRFLLLSASHASEGQWRSVLPAAAPL